jgi:hypothetical protein
MAQTENGRHCDPSGHYLRPDGSQLKVNRRSQCILRMKISSGYLQSTDRQQKNSGQGGKIEHYQT